MAGVMTAAKILGPLGLIRIFARLSKQTEMVQIRYNRQSPLRRTFAAHCQYITRCDRLNRWG